VLNAPAAHLEKPLPRLAPRLQGIARRRLFFLGNDRLNFFSAIKLPISKTIVSSDGPALGLYAGDGVEHILSLTASFAGPHFSVSLDVLAKFFLAL